MEEVPSHPRPSVMQRAESARRSRTQRRRSVTIVETAARWSASIAWRSPRNPSSGAEPTQRTLRTPRQKRDTTPLCPLRSIGGVAQPLRRNQKRSPAAHGDDAGLLERAACGTIRDVRAGELEGPPAVVAAAGVELGGMVGEGEQVSPKKLIELQAGGVELRLGLFD